MASEIAIGRMRTELIEKIKSLFPDYSHPQNTHDTNLNQVKQLEAIYKAAKKLINEQQGRIAYLENELNSAVLEINGVDVTEDVTNVEVDYTKPSSKSRAKSKATKTTKSTED